ncbi:MAG TPA: ABC transporter substrate-binding protein [Kiritimatiellia bacterium]|nr:ABC transporter substrate-binding protein [Kiritimatiellia bacterium]HMO51430.1 ABC transporter substrate-binding protein [Kiritimatiellia bacterium]HMO97855.1 ABC transporter substrate-binding protein [Kiritimatiellia bacterium]HMP97503.1 ABC transporter substrate-binding protein [Kiritimatiellia bacterium]
MQTGLMPPFRLAGWAGFFMLAACLTVGCGESSRTDRAQGDSTLYQDTLRIRGFDPVRAGDQPSALAIARIYETLLQYHYLDRPYRVEPLLAESLPEVSDDGLVYTFRIRPGIYFQDDPCFIATDGKGREVTADDFVYAVKRLADRKNQSVGYWTLSGRVVGLDDFREKSGDPEPTDYEQEIPGIRALDRYTLQWTLTQPYPQLLWILAMHYIVATPREAVAYYGPEFSRHPVGTGPYILKEWRQNYRLEYVRNPKWQETGRVDRYPSTGAPDDLEAGRLSDAGAVLPLTDRIVDYVVMDPATRWLKFITGQLDSSDVSRDNWEAILDDNLALNPVLAEKGIAMSMGPSLRLGYFAFNMEDPVLGPNRALRQAMTCAFDTEAWIQLFNGRITRPTGPIPEGLAGHDPDHHPFPFDLERARRLMIEAGYPEGRDPQTGRRLTITLELGRADDAELRQSAELFTFFMSRIGIQIHVSYNNGPAFFDKLERRLAPMFFLSWIGDYPDAENFLQLFYGPNASPGPNRCNYRNPDFDALYDVIRTMPDSPERTELYRKMAAIVVEDAPWIFAYQYINVGLRHPWFRNYKMHAFPYGMEKYYRVERP